MNIFFFIFKHQSKTEPENKATIKESILAYLLEGAVKVDWKFEVEE